MATEYIQFEIEPRVEGRATRFWWVTARQDRAVLGEVRWYTGWRKYCFWPKPGTVFDAACLRRIAVFAEERTRLHKEMATPKAGQ